jgi:hypothetical protein
LTYPFSNFSWNRVVIENTTERLAIGFYSSDYRVSGDGTHNLTGVINITLSAYATKGFGHWLPHLSHDVSTNQFDIQLQNLSTSSGFNHSRFALELVLASDGKRDSELIREKTRTIDDEHTPGIFEVCKLTRLWCTCF